MTTETSTTPINGNYGAQQSYHSTENTNSAAQAASGANGGHATTTANGHDSVGSGEGTPSVSKDEVGWYFVEQYYTTLSRSPEKLHVCQRLLFHSGP